MSVEYRELADYPGYRVGSDGSVWSEWRIKGRGENRHRIQSGEWKQIHASDNGQTGHLYVRLSGTRNYVHRLVMLAFAGPCPDGKEVCHNDSNPANNSFDNLRYDTRKNNLADRLKVGTMNWGERQGHAKLTADQVNEIRQRYVNENTSYSMLAQEYGLDHSSVYAIIKRKSWKHLP